MLNKTIQYSIAKV